MRVRAALLAAALALLGACSASAPPRDAGPFLASDNRARARVKAVLVARGDAASQMTAALLASSWSIGPRPMTRVPDADQLALARRAMQLAPSDPAIAWAGLTLCMGRPGCDAVAAAARFRAVDPMNAAGWLPDLRAAAAGSPQAVDAVLRSMARDTMFNVYYNRRVTLIADAYRRAGMTPLSVRAPRPSVLFAAAVATQSVPALQMLQALQVLSQSCADGARRAIRNDSCDAILHTMAHGDEVLIQALSAELRIRREEPGDPDRRAAQQWRRTWAWQRGQLGLVMAAPSVMLVPLRFNRRIAEELRLMARLPGEMDVMKAMLQRHGRAVEPPADWQPPGRAG